LKCPPSFPTRRSSDLKRTVASLMFGLPVYKVSKSRPGGNDKVGEALRVAHRAPFCRCATTARMRKNRGLSLFLQAMQKQGQTPIDRKSTRLNSSHDQI